MSAGSWVALVNTLVMAIVERRGALFLLRRIGATTRQLLSMTIWQTVILDLTGLTLGAAAAPPPSPLSPSSWQVPGCRTRQGHR
jgi:hypothetical protein